MKFHVKNMLSGLKSLDMFGHMPQLSLNGESAITTRFGAFVSLTLYGLMISNLI